MGNSPSDGYYQEAARMREERLERVTAYVSHRIEVDGLARVLATILQHTKNEIYWDYPVPGKDKDNEP